VAIVVLPLVLVVVLAGCLGSGDSGSDADSGGQRHAKAVSPPAPLAGTGGRGIHSYEGRVIRGWLLALEREDYDQAAYYFAPRALIDQGRPFRLKSESDARAFNASLPCRADLVELENEGATVLASFRLKRGPGGACSGTVRVRYTIRKGKFTEWRQLPTADSPDSPSESI